MKNDHSNKKEIKRLVKLENNSLRNICCSTTPGQCFLSSWLDIGCLHDLDARQYRAIKNKMEDIHKLLQKTNKDLLLYKQKYELSKK